MSQKCSLSTLNMIRLFIEFVNKLPFQAQRISRFHSFVTPISHLCDPFTPSAVYSLNPVSVSDRSGHQTYGRRVCPHCHNKYARLDVHIRNVHLKMKRFRCQFCEKRFGQSGHRLVHMRNVHKEVFDQTAAEEFFRREQLERGKLPIGSTANYENA